jgi:hypothetical protein
LVLPVIVGVGFTVTLVVPANEVQVPLLAVTLYKPVAAAVAAVMVGFCVALLKLFGPVHAYVTPLVELLEVKFKLAPLQMGELLDATGVAGV